MTAAHVAYRGRFDHARRQILEGFQRGRATRDHDALATQRGEPMTCSIVGLTDGGSLLAETSWDEWANAGHPTRDAFTSPEMGPCVLADVFPTLAVWGETVTPDRTAPVTLAIRCRDSNRVEIDGHDAELIAFRRSASGDTYAIRTPFHDGPTIAPGPLTFRWHGADVVAAVVSDASPAPIAPLHALSPADLHKAEIAAMKAGGDAFHKHGTAFAAEQAALAAHARLAAAAETAHYPNRIHRLASFPLTGRTFTLTDNAGARP